MLFSVYMITASGIIFNNNRDLELVQEIISPGESKDYNLSPTPEGPTLHCFDATDNPIVSERGMIVHIEGDPKILSQIIYRGETGVPIVLEPGRVGGTVLRTLDTKPVLFVGPTYPEGTAALTFSHNKEAE
jgi:hypothetical protein